jgi:hypothetical protein
MDMYCIQESACLPPDPSLFRLPTIRATDELTETVSPVLSVALRCTVEMI